jgi:filamentous hemagglutinin family protein
MPRLPPASPEFRRVRLSLLSGLVLLWALLAISQAQIALDGSLGRPGPLAGPQYRIGAELGQIRGGNLFHSFSEFNVPTGGSATFAGPNTIANILSRVTGGQPSAIDGMLRSEIAGAHLYLLNPSGVLFGPNASLAVSGSFHVSTADYLRFADGATFSANLGQASVLTVAEPAAFGFLGSTPAPITMQGSGLVGPTGNALSVVSGDITLAGGVLQAPSGRIQLASVAAPGEVGFSPLELAPDLQVDSFAQLGRIALSQGAFLDASGNGGGTILLRSGHLLVDGSAMFADNLGPMDGVGLGLDLRITADAIIRNGSFLTTDRLGAGQARDLQITAGRAHVEASGIGARGTGSGGARNVLVNVGALMLTGGAQIVADTSRSGPGAEVTIVATDMISIAGRGRLGPSGVFSNTFGSGNAGRITISAPMVQLDESLIQAGASPGSRGNAGSIDVRVGRLTLTGGAQINSTTFGDGRGGEITVMAADSISVAGHNTVGFPSGLFSAARRGGPGGTIRVQTRNIQLRDGGIISVGSAGAGDAGTIQIQAGETFRSERGSVTAAADRAAGGNILLRAGSLVQLIDSELTTRSGGGREGNLTLSSPFIALEGSLINAVAFGDIGGNLRIETTVLLLDLDSLIGASGTLSIAGMTSPPIGTLAPLPQTFVHVAALLPARCAARAQGGRYSSLVVGGRDGLPAEPGGLLPSPLGMDAQLVTEPAGIGVPRPPRSPARFAFLADAEKALPRLRGDPRAGGCPP